MTFLKKVVKKNSKNSGPVQRRPPGPGPAGAGRVWGGVRKCPKIVKKVKKVDFLSNFFFVPEVETDLFEVHFEVETHFFGPYGPFLDFQISDFCLPPPPPQQGPPRDLAIFEAGAENVLWGPKKRKTNAPG